MVSFDLSQLVDAAFRVQQLWEQQEYQFCFIGGLAIQHWGETRMTQDVDATIAVEFGNERALATRLLEGLRPRIDDAVSFAVVNRVLLAQEPGGVPIDISLAAMPYELGVIERSLKRELAAGKLIRICDASDLVILKAFANRPRDWQDIRGIIIRSGGQLDWQFVIDELSVLAELKEEPEILEQLTELRAKTD